MNKELLQLLNYAGNSELPYMELKSQDEIIRGLERGIEELLPYLKRCREVKARPLVKIYEQLIANAEQLMISEEITENNKNYRILVFLSTVVSLDEDYLYGEMYNRCIPVTKYTISDFTEESLENIDAIDTNSISALKEKVISLLYNTTDNADSLIGITHFGLLKDFDPTELENIYVEGDEEYVLEVLEEDDIFGKNPEDFFMKRMSF